MLAPWTRARRSDRRPTWAGPSLGPATSPTTAWPRPTWLALRLGRPLFLEGEPGVGKTARPGARRDAGPPLIRLQCYEGIDATQALYDWDFPRQILHLRAA